MGDSASSGAEGEEDGRGRERRSQSKLVLSEEPGCPFAEGIQVACDSALVHSTGGHGRGGQPRVLLVGAQGSWAGKGS